MGKRIALLCMSLNIGGAETHIFELAKGLTTLGHEVTVYSNGGVYADALEQAGIRHVRTPLHKKTPASLLSSYRILKKDFKTSRPDVVHSHTRISNFIGGMVCKKLNIPMVTTVHFNFRVGFFFKRFSNWGCRALAVSEDLKNYVVENYNYNPEHVSLTVNGIDMARFTKKELPEFRASLGVKPEQKIILLVTRLDKEASIHASRFFKLAPQIYRAVPDCRVVVVGGGKLYSTFEKEAEEINRSCGEEFILMQGPRTNIEEYTAVADLFVGISRSALEAMSSSVPTVLLGNLGYLGLYSEAIRKECIETNLTCRGYPYPSDDEISALIIDCLTQKDLSSNIQEGLRLVKERFSIETMAETASALYRDALNSARPLDYMISGYYGSDNFGDNLTLRCLMDHLQDYRGTVLTHNTQNTQVPKDVATIHRFNLWKIRKAMKKTKVFLLGSGSLLQDSTSNRSLFYYLFITRMAVRYHCKTLLYANGLGPISRKGNRKRTAQVLNKVDMITVRDRDSMDLLKDLNVERPAVLTADDAFSYRFENAECVTPPEDGRIAVGVNFKLEPGENLLPELAEGLKTLAQKYNLYFYLIPFHLSQDQPQLKELHKLIPEISELVEPSAEPQVLVKYVAAAKYQIFERLHGQIMATMLGTPFLPINYDPKNKSLMAQLGMDRHLLNHNELSAESLVKAFAEIYENSDAIRQQLTEHTALARKNAMKNSELLHKMIDS